MKRLPSTQPIKLGLLCIALAVLVLPNNDLLLAGAAATGDDELLWMQGGSIFVLDGEELSTIGETTGMTQPQADPVLADTNGDGADELYWYHNRPGEEGVIHRLTWNGQHMAYNSTARGPGIGQGHHFTAGDLNGTPSSGGDVFAAGVRYCASTYIDAGGRSHGQGQYGRGVDINNVIDLNTVDERDQQFGPDGEYDLGPKGDLYAPAAGSVTIEAIDSGRETGFGNSILWRSADGRETLQLSHLRSFGRDLSSHALGRSSQVGPGDHIGHIGDTGMSGGAHLHITREIDGQLVPLVLSGTRVRPNSCYISGGSQ